AACRAAARIKATVRGVLASCDQVGHEYGVEVLSGQAILQPSLAPLDGVEKWSGHPTVQRSCAPFAVVEKRPERSFRTAAAPCLCRATFRISQSSIPSRSTLSTALAIGPSFT